MEKGIRINCNNFFIFLLILVLRTILIVIKIKIWKKNYSLFLFFRSCSDATCYGLPDLRLKNVKISDVRRQRVILENVRILERSERC